MRLGWLLALSLSIPVAAQTTVAPSTTLAPNNTATTWPGPSTYTFVASTFKNEASGSTPALTLTAGDFVFLFCSGSGTSSTTYTASSTPSNTWVGIGTAQVASGNVTQGFYTLSAGSGSTTFLCTQGGSGGTGNLSPIALQYHYSGAGAALDTGISSTSAGGPTYVSSSFTTTSADLIIQCARAGADNVKWVGGVIGSGTATVRNAARQLPNSITDSACQDIIFSTTQSGITAAMNAPSTSGTYPYVVGAFK